MEFSDLVALASLVIAVAAFIAVAWQIIRSETMQPQEAWWMEREIIEETEEHIDMRILLSTQGRFVADGAEFLAWNCDFVRDIPLKRTVSATSDPLEAVVRIYRGRDAYVGAGWIRSSVIRRRPVLCAFRRDPLGGRETYQRWHWKWLDDPRPSHPAQRGRWKGLDRSWGPNQSDFPDPERPFAGTVPRSGAAGS